MVMWSRFQGLVIIEWGERAVSPRDFETAFNVQSEAASEKLQPGGGKEGLRTRIVREKGGGREEKTVEVNFLAGWWEETNYFPSARSHDGFLRFRWRVGGCFLGIRARVWVFDGRDWFDWVAVDRVVDFLSERERKRERLIGCTEKIMRCWSD